MATVQELIDKLEAIEDKSRTIIAVGNGTDVPYFDIEDVCDDEADGPTIYMSADY